MISDLSHYLNLDGGKVPGSSARFPDRQGLWRGAPGCGPRASMCLIHLAEKAVYLLCGLKVLNNNKVLVTVRGHALRKGQNSVTADSF